ncbi:MAG TPA: putative metallopeptidase, partial [Deinococcales bacterium]|nr:putative metallopeptidase [Deinococcales bacterium]
MAVRVSQPSLFDPPDEPVLRLAPRGRPRPYDLTAGLEEAARAVSALVPELQAIKTGEVLFTVYPARLASRSYTIARCYPLPWEARRKARRWQKLTAHVTPSGARARYILAFAWPRFFTLPPRDRLETLLHELYHIGPNFDGQPRAFPGYGWHGRSLAWFDAQVRGMAERHVPAGTELTLPALARPLAELRDVKGERLILPTWWTVASAAETPKAAAQRPAARLSDPG